MISGFGGALLVDTLATATSGPTAGVTRQADPSTMDDYIRMLDFDVNTRWAGRLWSDKSVFAYGYADEGDRVNLWNRRTNVLKLSELLDGVSGEIPLTDDFLHVYSALGSSLEVTGVPPVRTVIVFDNSGSMYTQDTWDETRIAKTVDAINASIDILMLSSQYNEVSVVLFGDGAKSANTNATTVQYDGNNTAVTILPMKHYQPCAAAKNDYENNRGIIKPGNNTSYLKAGWCANNEAADGGTPDHSTKAGGGWVFVDNTVCKLRKQDTATDSDNSGHGWYKSSWNGWNNCGNASFTSYRNGTTNIQAGIYQGMQELLTANKTERVGTQIYQCVPSLVMLTDGAVTDALDNWLSPTQSGGILNTSVGFVNDFSYKGTSFVEHNDPRGKGGDSSNTAWNQFLEVKWRDGSGSPLKSPSDELTLAKEGKLYYDLVARTAAGALEFSTYTYSNHGVQFANATQLTGDSLLAAQKMANQYRDDEAYMVFTYLLTAAYYKQAVKSAYNVDPKKEWGLYTVTIDMIDPKSEGFSAGFESDNTTPESAGITSNPAMMDPSNYFSTAWLEETGYLKSGAAGETDNTFYDDYTIGDMTVEGVKKAIEAWEKWNNGAAASELGLDHFRSIQSGYNFFSNGIKDKIVGFGAGETFPGPGHSSFFRIYGEQKLGTTTGDGDFYIPTLAEAKASAKRSGFEITDGLSFNYVTDAYYANVAGGGGADLAHVFVEIITAITEPLFAPVGGVNDLGVGDAVTFMDPVGKYMDVKDVKGLVLFGVLYGITKTAVYDYRWNHQYMLNLGSDTTPLLEGWYKGTPLATGDADGNADVDYSADTIPPGCKDAKDAFAQGWVFRVSFETASKFVPTLTDINNPNPDEMINKMRRTEYTFYRLDIEPEERNELRVNPAYLTKGQTAEEVLSGKSYDEGGAHKKTPGVYALSDLRIWVEDSGDFNDTAVSDTLTDSNFDEALWINIPVNMLPLRTVSIDLGKTGENDKVWEYKSNLDSDSDGYLASFPLRVFYSVGMSEDVLEASNRINIAGAISAEYIQNNKVRNVTYAEARGIAEGNLEFFSNWYNPQNRYSDYATTRTDYSYGDPVTSFSPSTGNRYYAFEKALPLYSAVYVWMPDEKKESVDGTAPTYGRGEGRWRLAVIGEDVGDVEGSTTFDATTFGGELIAQDLEPADTQTTPEDRQNAIWDALSETDEGITQVHDGDMILLKKHRLTDVTGPEEEASDPFKSESYFFLPIDYYALDGEGHATWMQYVITRKGSEFGSSYSAGGITNGDMLCWHDVSGDNTQNYPYLSYSETSGAGNPDPSRGRQYIGAPLGKDGYYSGCDRSVHAIPSENNGTYEENEKTNEDWKGVYDRGEWVVCAKPGGLRVGDLAQNVQSKGGVGYVEYADYVAERFPDRVAEDASFRVGYYTGETVTEEGTVKVPANTTRTANNYYVPTISHTSNIERSDIKVNVYLGNNGRLYVMDTTLLVTKLVELPDGFVLSDAGREEEFNFQIFLSGIRGKMDAVVVQWNPNVQNWQRQFHYIDLELDSQLFLQTSDGTRATVDGSGCRIVSDSSGAYTYTDFCRDKNGVNHAPGDPYEGPVYYVFIGRNRGTTETGVADTAFRVYHNENMQDGSGSVDSTDVRIDGEQGMGGTFYAATVWLVSTDTFEGKWRGQELVSDESFDIERLDPEDSSRLYDVKIDDASFPLLSIDPNVSSSTTDIFFSTPYSTISAYWTKQVEFGRNTNKNDDCPTEGDVLTAAGLYDPLLPTADRPDYFKGLSNETIALYTAEFTLRHGQALLFSGIPADTVYRVTEKLTADQMARGYTLKEISHDQQVGSVSVYRPGVQKVPVHIFDGATYGDCGKTVYPADYLGNGTENGLTWSVNQAGETNSDAYLREEAFYHTNAVMWEYYSTLAADAIGDGHHQPAGSYAEGRGGSSPFYLWDAARGTNEAVEGSDGLLQHEILDNPRCMPLEEGGCDEAILDEEGAVTSYRHYIFREGVLLDRHYEGEGSGYLRGICRYLVSPTVHFGVNGEGAVQSTDPAALPESGEYDYNGVYSVFGDTGIYEESVNFVNTADPDMLVLTKDLVDLEGADIPLPPDKTFDFTLKLTPAGKEAMADSDGKLFYWKGLKADLGETVEAGGPPKLNEYTSCSESLFLAEPGEDGSYHFPLKADEAVVIYGLVAGTGYEITETEVENYPAVDGESHTVTAPEYYSQTGTVTHNVTDRVVMRDPAKTANRSDFYNQVATGLLTVQKKISDEGAEEVTRDFGFKVELTPAKTASALNKEELTAVKYLADGSVDPDFSYEFVEIDADEDGNPDGGLFITFRLKHKETVVLGGLPFGTKFTVTETDRVGYNLQHVADNLDDLPTDGAYLPITDGSVEGTITREAPRMYTLFSNAKPAELPFTGSYGLSAFYGIGALILIAGMAVAVKKFA